MREYEVTLNYTGFITRTVKAQSKGEAIKKARLEHNAPLRLSAFMRNFEPILETLEPGKECDTVKLKKK